MRTIIFRAWDRTSNKEGKMVLWEELKKYKCEDVFLPCEIEMVAVTLMQFTGLKDKNGVEIYEGDILKSFGNNFRFIVIFDRGCFCAKRADAEWTYTLHDYFLRNNANNLQGEIIGNIHQNPELLK